MAKTRRAFIKAAGAIPALAAAATVPLPAQTRTPTPAPTPGAEPKPGPLARLARERYGKFLTAEELRLLDEDMDALERRSARLRGYELANSEEPAVDFAATRR